MLLVYKECGSQSEVMPKEHPQISTTVIVKKGIKVNSRKAENCILELIQLH